MPKFVEIPFDYAHSVLNIIYINTIGIVNYNFNIYRSMTLCSKLVHTNYLLHLNIY